MTRFFIDRTGANEKRGRMSEISGIHDRFFKARFGQIDHMRGLLRGFLPASLSRALDYDSLNYIDTEKIGLSYEKAHLDLVLSARVDDVPVQIYLLFEHKSAPDPSVFLQLLRYMVALWTLDQGNDKRPTPVLPFIFYHGTPVWSFPERFLDFCSVPELLRPYALDFSSLVLDTGRVPDQEIRQAVNHLGAAASLIALKHIFDKTPLEYAMALEPLGAELDSGTFQNVLDYILIYREIEDPKVTEIITETLHRSERMPNIVEKWMNVGRQEGRQEDIAKLLRRKILTPSEIASVLEVDLAWVLEIQDALNETS